MRRLTIILALFGALVAWAASALPAQGADRGTVTAQVTVATPCITLSTSAISFGTLPFARTGGNSLGDSTDFTVQNCGGAPQDVFIRGTDATGPTASWHLTDAGITGSTCSLGLDQYRIAAFERGNAWMWLFLTTSDQLAASRVAGASVTAWHKIFMPCTGSSGAGETVTMQIVYTAAF